MVTGTKASSSIKSDNKLKKSMEVEDYLRIVYQLIDLLPPYVFAF